MSEPTPATTATATTTTSENSAGTQVQATTSTAVKPGWKTTEYWLTKIVAIIGSLMATGVIANGSDAARIGGAIMAALAVFGYTYSRGVVKGAATLGLFLLIGATLATAPACSGSSREAHLRDAMTGLNIASSAFVAFDKERQAQIVEKSTSVADGTAKLEAYKATRAHVFDLFAAAYHAIAAAAVLNKDDTSAVNALLAAKLALTAWADLKGGTP